jgi:hypothetical protein
MRSYTRRPQRRTIGDRLIDDKNPPSGAGAKRARSFLLSDPIFYTSRTDGRDGMLTIEWIRNRGPEMPPGVVETMSFPGSVPADAVAHAKSLFADTRARLPLNPPDGFRIVDAAGREVALWFADSNQHA